MKVLALCTIFLSIVSFVKGQTLSLEGSVRLELSDTSFGFAQLGVDSSGLLRTNNWQIGDTLFGGIVFYLDPSSQHGLICDTSDLSDGIPWMVGPFRLIRASGHGLGDGFNNTVFIVKDMISISDSFAARICADHKVLRSGTLYGDWYLPSKNEMLMAFENLHQRGLGNFAIAPYWTSTEIDASNAVVVNFGNINNISSQKNNPFVRVRAIRKF